MQHQGATQTAKLIADVTSLEIKLWNTQWGEEGYLVTLVVEPSLLPRYTSEALKPIGEESNSCSGQRARTLTRSAPARRFSGSPLDGGTR